MRHYIVKMRVDCNDTNVVKRKPLPLLNTKYKIKFQGVFDKTV